MSGPRRGKAYIVGAGPGDPGLITLKGLECVKEADVVIYDRLVHKRLLEHARPDAELIYVGKDPGRHEIPQERISLLIAEKAAEGKVVTRLKGGDPFVFGRGGEEAEVLVEAGIPFEIVPGVTSVVAVPAYAGIPITHRDHTSSFAVITGRESSSKPDSRIAWDKVSGIGTLVILMGVKNMPFIVEQLLVHGRDPRTPVALIGWGTLPSQRTLVGTLANIVEKIREADFHPPAVAVIGEVVSLRERLRWFDNRPLFGKRVLVTRSREQASVLSRLLEQSGAEPVELPTIEFQPSADGLLETAIRNLASYDWIVFTSANGVKVFMARLDELGLDARAIGRARICAIGPATTDELRRHNLRPDFVPREFVAEAVAEGLISLGVEGKRILLPRAQEARELIVAELIRAGAIVEDIAAYRTVAPCNSEDRLRKALGRKIDVITLTSSSTVRNLVSTLREHLGEAETRSFLHSTTVACIGPITAHTARELGMRVDVVASEYTIPGLVDAIVKHYQEASAPV